MGLSTGVVSHPSALQSWGWHPRNAPHPSYTSLTRFQVLHLQYDLRHHSICWDLRGCEAWSRCTRDCRAHSFRLGTLGLKWPQVAAQSPVMVLKSQGPWTRFSPNVLETRFGWIVLFIHSWKLWCKLSKQLNDIGSQEVDREVKS